MATSAILLQKSSPVFTSHIQISPLNSRIEAAAFPAVPATVDLYGVVSTANTSDYKVTAHGHVGEAPELITDMEA